MSTKHLLDPDLHPITELFPSELALRQPEILAMMREAASTVMPPDEASAEAHSMVTRTEVRVPVNNHPDVRCLLYTPNAAAESRAAYLHIHGGGYILGSADASDADNVKLAAKSGIVILSVDYRLAPEHNCAASLEDCYGALAWLHNNAAAHNIDARRIAIGGESAGGGLAAGLAILARGRGEYGICHQHLTYPMLDNLTGSAEHFGDPLVGEFVWDRVNNQFGWESYLGDQPAIAPQVPARLEDFSDLPSTWLATASLDLFRDENIDYAKRLLAAGVNTELTIYPRACHGFNLMPGPLTDRYVRDHAEALSRAVAV